MNKYTVKIETEEGAILTVSVEAEDMIFALIDATTKVKQMFEQKVEE